MPTSSMAFILAGDMAFLRSGCQLFLLPEFYDVLQERVRREVDHGDRRWCRLLQCLWSSTLTKLLTGTLDMKECARAFAVQGWMWRIIHVVALLC